MYLGCRNLLACALPGRVVGEEVITRGGAAPQRRVTGRSKPGGERCGEGWSEVQGHPLLPQATKERTAEGRGLREIRHRSGSPVTDSREHMEEGEKRGRRAVNDGVSE